MQQPPIGQSLELSGLICSEEWWPMDRVRLMRRWRTNRMSRAPDRAELQSCHSGY